MAVVLSLAGMPRQRRPALRVREIVGEARRLMLAEPVTFEVARQLAFFADVDTGLAAVARIYTNLNRFPRPALTSKQRLVLRSLDAAHLVLRWRRWCGDRREIVRLQEAV